ARQGAIPESRGELISPRNCRGNESLTRLRRLIWDCGLLSVFGLTELQFIESLLQFFDTQQHPSVLAQQLPAEPGASQNCRPGQTREGQEKWAHRVAAG